MTKITKSLAIVAVVVALASAGTYALWSSQASITGNTFSTGSMNLKVDANPDPAVQQWETTFGVPANYYVKDLYPGYPSKGEHNWQVIDIMNTGTVDGTASITLARTSAWNALAGNLVFTMYYDALNNGTFVPTGVSGTLDQYTGTYTLGSIGAGKIASVKVEWTLPTSAGNDTQNLSETFDAVFGLQ